MNHSSSPGMPTTTRPRDPRPWPATSLWLALLLILGLLSCSSPDSNAGPQGSGNGVNVDVLLLPNDGSDEADASGGEGVEDVDNPDAPDALETIDVAPDTDVTPEVDDTDAPDLPDQPELPDLPDTAEVADLPPETTPEVSPDVQETDGPCLPQCQGKTCGPDGCGGLCGECEACGTDCVNGACAFVACQGMDCGLDGCGGECGGCEDGFACADGACVEVGCTGENLQLSGSFGNAVAAVSFDSVDATVQHKRDVDAWEDGCLSEVSLHFRRGEGCSLLVRAGLRFDVEGKLEIQFVRFEADSQCPGFNDSQEGVYEAAQGISGDLLGAGIALGIEEVPDQDVPESCFNTSFVVHLRGALIETTSGLSLELPPSSLTVSGDIVSLGSYDNQCPCQPVCGPFDCGDAGCGFSCGQCGCGESCDDGHCTFHNCDGKSCGSDGCGGSCGGCDDALGCTLDACVNGGCQHDLAAAYCLIDGTCYGDGALDPTNACHSCLDDLDSEAWTLKPDGAACGIGKVCFQDSCCESAAHCFARECGSDACGGSCGSCPATHDCSAAGLCTCEASCGGKDCGDDGCGGSCGSCAFDQAAALCIEGGCVMGACDPGWIDENGVDSDGCEEPCTGSTGETDHPDMDNVDSNCDGVDGMIDRAYFVASSGDDNAAGDMDHPFKTVGHAIPLAKGHNPPWEVYVAAGVYDERIELAGGVHLYGGFDPETWTHAPELFTTRLKKSGADGGGTRTLIANNVDLKTIVAGFTIEAPGNSDASGNAVAVTVVGSAGPIRLDDDHIIVGSGGSGLPGQNGKQGEPGGTGQSGNYGCQYDDCTLCAFCGTCNRPAGGSPGSGACDNSGGKGGSGGAFGNTGYYGYSSEGSYSAGGYGGYEGNDGGSGSIGLDGPDSPDGHGGDGLGLLGSTGIWQSTPGWGGYSGRDGTGGGGGGGGGGEPYALFECATYGASGGGGGAGGCAGTGGLPGTGGGASIAVLSHNSTVVLLRCSVSTGDGGNGGPGGSGGTGGAGG